MANFETIEVDSVGDVLWLWLSRPEKRNAISEQMLTEISSVVDEVRRGFGTRVLVLAAKGRTFCAGADLGEDPAATPSIETLEASTVLFNAIEDLEQPVIASVQGAACAGGLELLLTTDIILASESARFADIHATIGLIPGAGGAYRLPQWVGLPMAKRMLLTGDFYDARTMRDAGLVSEVVPDDDLFRVTSALAQRLASKSPQALAAMKRLSRMALGGDRDAAMRAALQENAAHFGRDDYAEGLAAFAQRRAPVFVGH